MSATERMRHDALQAFGEFPEAVAALPTFGEFKAHVQRKRLQRWRVWSAVFAVAITAVVLWSINKAPMVQATYEAPLNEPVEARIESAPAFVSTAHVPRTRARIEHRDTPAESAAETAPQTLTAFEVSPIVLLSRTSIEQTTSEMEHAHFAGKLAWVNGFKLSADELEVKDVALRERAESLLTGSVEVWREHPGDVEESLPVEMYTTDNYERATLLMQQSAWDEALVLWNARLKESATSVNALFYKGYCAFQLRDYATAEECFAALRFRSDAPFAEEALFYLAVSKAKNGDEVGARELFSLIATSGGAYAAKASSMLK